jgi:hypothetical protein
MKDLKVYNNTNLSLEELDQLKLIGITFNNWRQRKIRLLEHPNNPERLISDGTSFDHEMRVIADEPRSAWARELLAIEQGRVHVSN